MTKIAIVIQNIAVKSSSAGGIAGQYPWIFEITDIGAIDGGVLARLAIVGRGACAGEAPVCALRAIIVIGGDDLVVVVVGRALSEAGVGGREEIVAILQDDAVGASEAVGGVDGAEQALEVASHALVRDVSVDELAVGAGGIACGSVNVFIV